jgi:DNA-binding NtrC family response regulator
LAREATEGRFRPDLLHRLRVGRVQVPPLRERAEDISLLADSFLADHSARVGRARRQFSVEAMSQLRTYHWPGNVRELKNAVEYAAIRSSSHIIESADLPPEIMESAANNLQSDHLDERSRILLALGQAKGNRSLAAELLGISRATFYRRLTQLGINDE